MDTQQIIKDRLEVLPEDIKQAIQSADLGNKFEAIAQKHGLMIDQNGSLQTETILVMLGLEPTSDYIDNIQRELEVSRNEAVSISNDVNTEIFSAIRSSLQSMQEGKEEDVDEDTVVEIKETPAIPQPTIFTPEKPPVGMGGSPSTPINQVATPNIDREAVLKGIEDPKVESDMEPEHAMVDHLLSAPVKTVSEVEIKKAPEITPPAPVAPEKKSSILDAYREQI